MDSFVTTGICFWCGAETGISRSNFERNKRAVLSYEPCTPCNAEFEAGIVFFEAGDQPVASGQPPAMPRTYPSGRYAILTADQVDAVFEPKRATQLKTDRVIWIRPDAFK